MSEENPLHYAGFWRRFGAVILDYILFNSLLFLLIYAVYGGEYVAWLVSAGGQLSYGWLDGVARYLLVPVVIIAFWLRLRATPGKLLMSCAVVDADTQQRLRPGQAVMRYLGYFVSALPLCLGFLWVVFDRRKQGFHDKIANTVVIIEDDSDRLLRHWEGQR